MSMFCFQCEQTAGGKGCTKIGVCGKQPEVANSQDELTCALIGLARASQGKSVGPQADSLVRQGLFTTITNVNFDSDRVKDLIKQVRAEKNKLDSAAADFAPSELWNGDPDIVSLRSTLLLGMRGMAAYAEHAAVLNKDNPEVTAWFYKGLQALGEEHSAEEWLGLLMEFGKVNLACMALLDEANTSAYGHPKPTKVSLTVEKGPFIVVTGHDLLDLKQLLEQTEGKGVNVYTHGEMLPAHAYPEFKKYPHLKGNFGTAWQNQQKEFDNIPAPILFTTNCLMVPKSSYSDRVFTTSVVAFPGAQHISDSNVKDFSALIDKAIELGGWPEDKELTGINGGKDVMTGFARNTVMSVAGTVIDAVKAGAIKHFFLVGGCDGAKPGRNYYTEFVQKAPKDTVILTLACGKYRFNDLDIGEIGGLPRIMDMGQCNDAYSAIQVAVALADAFKCGVNDLPLTLVLSWYEQKAVCILLTLLALGIKNIYIGPSLPAFLSPNVLNILVSKFDLHPITTPENDLQTILK
ncbi:Hydroxylamine reductase [Sporomusa ovata DSM 2662]|uniref:Hydroxylamine reductase n=1 Tax=Sporomusa ovata TaxID=2378 RepID=A0A0U1L684_9FIRM|nr:hydroxylamine reductase [Sporomusa ovata]EQB24678.1 hydroxylamine reductase [Sporomusa ovata DSM 2662]CQR75025.1 Hydroxylamine reductase [Sporomusa ovata]